MAGLYRFECTNCGNVEKTNEFYTDHCPECGDNYTMDLQPSPEHDKQIMESPPSHFECPNCNSAIYAAADETGDDWHCNSDGGCGFTNWREENSKIRPPNDFSEEEHARFNAWSRYQRHKKGHFDY